MRTDANWIQMGVTGGQFWPTDPRPQDVHIEDIAHAQSQLCRFTGHTRTFYSVAQHSVRVMKAVESFGPSLLEGYGLPAGPELNRRIAQVALWGILHDSEEAYINDLSTPVKRLPDLTGYKAVAENLRHFLVGCFGLFGPEPAVVKQADQWLLYTEAKELMRPCTLPGSIQTRHEAPPHGRVKRERPMGSIRAKYRFLFHYWRLRGIIDQDLQGVNLYAYAICRLFRR